MANRIVNNVMIIDSAMGNQQIMFQVASSQQMKFFHTNAVAFWSSDTTGRMILSAADTTNHLISMGWVNGGAGFTPATQTTAFGQVQVLADLKIPVLTAGTAWLYLC